MSNPLDAELAKLNNAVAAAIAARRTWMDANMVHYAIFKVGDEIYDLDRGRLLGTVTELYRFHADRDPRYDDSMSIDYRYQERPGGLIDNTSRQIGLIYGTKADYEDHLKYRLAALHP